MAKKSFKGGLGSLLESTFNKAGLEKQNNTNSSPSTDRLQQEIDVLKTELALWRKGELNKQLFDKNIEEAGLFYDSEANSIRKRN